MIKKIYIACPFANKDIAIQLAAHLLRAGFEVVSGWHFGDTEYEPSNAARADRDWQEVKLADTVVYVLDIDRQSGGGCHTELGMALAYEKKIFVFDPRAVLRKETIVFDPRAVLGGGCVSSNKSFGNVFLSLSKVSHPMRNSTCKGYKKFVDHLLHQNVCEKSLLLI